MGYSNVAGDLNVAGTSTLSTLVVSGSTFHYGPITSTSNAAFSNLVATTLTVTGNFIVTATNTSVSNALSIVNQGSATALYVNQNESVAHVHNVAEFYDHTQLAMVIDPHGNVAIHQASSPGYALSVVDGVSMDVLTLGAPLAISSGRHRRLHRAQRRRRADTLLRGHCHCFCRSRGNVSTRVLHPARQSARTLGRHHRDRRASCRERVCL